MGRRLTRDISTIIELIDFYNRYRVGSMSTRRSKKKDSELKDIIKALVNDANDRHRKDKLLCSTFQDGEVFLTMNGTPLTHYHRGGMVQKVSA